MNIALNKNKPLKVTISLAHFTFGFYKYYLHYFDVLFILAGTSICFEIKSTRIAHVLYLFNALTIDVDFTQKTRFKQGKRYINKKPSL
jgi:hypothetical protein